METYTAGTTALCRREGNVGIITLNRPERLNALNGERSPLALRLSRIAIDQGMDASFDQILEIETHHLLHCVGTQNHVAYVEGTLAEMKRS